MIDRKLRAALSLSKKEQHILSLAIKHGYFDSALNNERISAIAKELGTTEDEVSEKLRRALRKLSILYFERMLKSI